MTMTALPKFTLEGYRNLLDELVVRGARFRPMNRMGQGSANDVFLRHDLDFSLELALPMARIEHSLGISSTYYVLLSGPYNPCTSVSVLAMRELARLGHDLGLHYDLSLYPADAAAARKRLTHEIAFLQELSGARIETIVMHEPFRGQEDMFLAEKDWINPTFYQKYDPQLLYVSDSCRAWRDKSLIQYLQGATVQNRLLLNTHPESWLAERSQHRLSYLEQTLLPRVLEPTRRYFMEQVRYSWETHVGPVKGYGDDDE